MIHFLDASALVKRYVREAGTDAVGLLFRRGRTLAMSRVSIVEVPAALARRVRRGDIPSRQGQDAAGRFAEDAAAFAIVEVRARVLDQAAALVWEADLRAYDALQLASAAELARQTASPVTFVAADAGLLRAATAKGLRAQAVG